jgi:hypothetical protein
MSDLQIDPKAIFNDYLGNLLNSSAGAVHDTQMRAVNDPQDFATEYAALALGAAPDIAAAVPNVDKIIAGEKYEAPWGTDSWNEWFKEHGLQSEHVSPEAHYGAVGATLFLPAIDTVSGTAGLLEHGLHHLPVTVNMGRKVLSPLRRDVSAIESGMRRKDQDIEALVRAEEAMHPRLYRTADRLAEQVERAEKAAGNTGKGLIYQAETYPGQGAPEGAGHLAHLAELEHARGGPVHHALKLAQGMFGGHYG